MVPRTLGSSAKKRPSSMDGGFAAGHVVFINGNNRVSHSILMITLSRSEDANRDALKLYHAAREGITGSTKTISERFSSIMRHCTKLIRTFNALYEKAKENPLKEFANQF